MSAGSISRIVRQTLLASGAPDDLDLRQLSGLHEQFVPDWIAEVFRTSAFRGADALYVAEWLESKGG